MGRWLSQYGERHGTECVALRKEYYHLGANALEELSSSLWSKNEPTRGVRQ
jgi:hypothetical protein